MATNSISGNRTIKDAPVRRFYYESHGQLRQRLADFVAAYNFARRLETLKVLTPRPWPEPWMPTLGAVAASQPGKSMPQRYFGNAASFEAPARGRFQLRSGTAD
jgi:hypothetical protein